MKERITVDCCGEKCEELCIGVFVVLSGGGTLGGGSQRCGKCGARFDVFHGGYVRANQPGAFRVDVQWWQDEILVECQTCKRPEGAVNHVAGHVFVGWGIGWQPCPTCGGSTKVWAPVRDEATDVCCETSHRPVDAACRAFEAGMNGRCAFCDHEGKCHPGPGATCEIGSGEGGTV